MWDDIECYVQTCLLCQQDKVEKRQPGVLLEPLPVAKRLWESVTMDFIISLPKSSGFGTIMVVVDRFSKYAPLCLSQPVAPQKKLLDYSSRTLWNIGGFPDISLVTETQLYREHLERFVLEPWHGSSLFHKFPSTDRRLHRTRKRPIKVMSKTIC